MQPKRNAFITPTLTYYTDKSMFIANSSNECIFYGRHISYRAVSTLTQDVIKNIQKKITPFPSWPTLYIDRKNDTPSNRLRAGVAEPENEFSRLLDHVLRPHQQYRELAKPALAEMHGQIIDKTRFCYAIQSTRARTRFLFRRHYPLL